jgi:Tol biopolymer transport system component
MEMSKKSCFFQKHRLAGVFTGIVFSILVGCSRVSLTDTLGYETITPTAFQSAYTPTTLSPTPLLSPTDTSIPPTKILTYPPSSPLLAFTMEFNPFTQDAYEVIYTIRADGTELTRLVEEPANSCCPGWSPDGSLIAFLGRDPDDWFFYKLYVLNYESGNVLQISTEHVGTFTWAPDSQRIAYTEELASPAYYSESSPSRVILVNLLTGQQSLLYDAPWPILRLLWSPSSDLILIVTPSGEENNRLHLLDLQGNLTQYSLYQKAGSDFTWHPSGEQIAYDTFVDSSHTRSDIRVINVDGTNDHILIHSDDNSYGSQWSPSGDLLAYIRQPLGGVPRVYITDLCDGRSWLVPQGRGKPVWSSDGSYLAYYSDTRLIQETGYGLYVYSIDNDTAEALVEEYITFGWASWRPYP